MPAAAALPRALLRLAALAAVLVVGIALSPLAARCAPGRRARLVRLWCRALLHAVGVRLRVDGDLTSRPGRAGSEGCSGVTGEGGGQAGGSGRNTTEGRAGVLVVANHISWLDIPVLAAVRPARMLAKSEVRTWPVAGRLAVRGRTLFIDRSRPRALPGTVAGIAAALRDGAAVAAFPEGSTWCGRDRGPFRRAVFQAALDAHVPVQPVGIAYALGCKAPSTTPAFVGDDTLIASVWRVAAARGLVARVRIPAALDVGDHPDRRSLARAAQDAVDGAPSAYRRGGCGAPQ